MVIMLRVLLVLILSLSLYCVKSYFSVCVRAIESCAIDYLTITAVVLLREEEDRYPRNYSKLLKYNCDSFRRMSSRL